MDVLWDLLQQWQIWSQQSATASLQQRVESLERQLHLVRQILAVLLKEQRPEVQQLLAKVEAPWPSLSVHHWCVVRQEAQTAVDELLPQRYETQAEADAEARQLLQADLKSRVFVIGPQGQRYRVLP
jgi:hypothetical protein